MPDAPKRIQRKRTKGWRMPEGAVVVSRPSRWGNPFSIGSIKLFSNDDDPTDRVLVQTRSAEEAVANFRWLVSQPHRAQMIRDDLRGKPLACWCPITSHGKYVPCHADVLLCLANDMTMDEVIRENTRGQAGDTGG